MANNFSNFFENYKPTDPRSSISYKHKNQEKEIHQDASQSNSLKPVIKRKSLCQKKRHIYIDRTRKMRMTMDLLAKIKEIRKQQNNIFKAQEKESTSNSVYRENIFQK